MESINTLTIIKSKKKKLFNKKILLVFILAALVIYIGIYYVKPRFTEKPQIEQQTAIVRRGDLKVAINGSGTLASSSTSDILSTVEGRISRIYFKDGELVKAGDLLAEIDSREAELDLKKIENNIAQGRLSIEQLLKSLGSGNIIAPISGEITEVKFKEGDTVGKDGIIFTITDKSKLKLLLPFYDSYGNELQINQKATLYIFNSTLDEMITTEGTISYISFSGESESELRNYNVEFTIENNGQFDDTMIASGEINLENKTVKSIGNTKLSYGESINVKTETGGIITMLNANLGQFAKKGETLAQIENSDLSIELETKKLNQEDMENQLAYSKDKITQYKVYSPIDGTLAIESISKGDNVKSGQTLFKVSNYDLMEFQISVDELDIAAIQTNQKVNITVDALTETNTTPLEGIVTKIALEGTPNNGVSTYPVTVQLLKSNKDLKAGMNVNGEIIVNEKKDVLYVPIEAVQKRGPVSIVYVKSDETEENPEESLDAQWEYNDENRQSAPRRSQRSNEDFEETEAGFSRRERQTQDTQRPQQSEISQGSKESQESKEPLNIEEPQRPQETLQLPSSEGPSSNIIKGEGYYQGAIAKVVKIGINNDEYIEIIQGLKEREIIILPQSYGSSGTSNSTQNRFTGGGGMQGGMPFSMPGGQRR